MEITKEWLFSRFMRVTGAVKKEPLPLSRPLLLPLFYLGFRAAFEYEFLHKIEVCVSGVDLVFVKQLVYMDGVAFSADSDEFRRAEFGGHRVFRGGVHSKSGHVWLSGQYARK